MNIIEVTGCSDCPFKSTDLGYFYCSYPNIEGIELIKTDDMCCVVYQILDNCPLKKECLTIKLKESING